MPLTLSVLIHHTQNNIFLAKGSLHWEKAKKLRKHKGTRFLFEQVYPFNPKHFTVSSHSVLSGRMKPVFQV